MCLVRREISVPEPEKMTWYRLVAIGILLLGFALRAATLVGRPLWFDEAWEYWIATAAFSDLLTTVKNYLRDPPLYSYLLHLWVQLDAREFWLRFPSLLFSILNILGVMSLARLAFGKPAALLAALFVTVAASDLRYAQEAGQYIVMVSFLSWSLVCLMRFLQTSEWRWAVLWASAALLATYTFYGAPLPILATALVSAIHLASNRRWRAFSMLASAGLFSLLLLAPLLLDILPAQLAQPSGAITPPTAVAAFDVELQAFLSGARSIMQFQQMGYQAGGWVWQPLPEWIAWLPGLLLLVAGVVRLRFSLPFVWLFTSLAFYYWISKSGLYHFDGRYSLILAPLLWVCLAAGAMAMWQWRRAAAIVLTGTIVLLSLLAPSERAEDLRAVTQLWLNMRRNHEQTYVYYGAAPGFRYQLRMAGAENSTRGVWFWDCWWREGRPPACAHDGIVYGRWLRNLTPEAKLDSIFTTLGEEPARFWIVFSHVHAGEDESILTALGASYTIARAVQLDGASAILLLRK